MAKKTKRKTDRILDILFPVVFIALATGLLYGGYKIYTTLQEYKIAEETYDSLIDDYVTEETIINEDDEEEIRYSVDFNALWEINQDVVGWLKQDDTVIDYPVVKGKDNNQYLRHLINGEWNNAGTLFIDFRNRDIFMDQITVIYGHNMRNGSMFHCLEDYQKPEYYAEHKKFYFYTPDKTYILEPLAGNEVDATIPFLQFNFINDQDYVEYMQPYINASTFRSDVEFSPQDRLLLMISCSYDYQNARYLLFCRITEANN